MITWGISSESHDAALSVIKNDEIVFAAHSERYSKKKNDGELHPELLAAGLNWGVPDKIYFYENPRKKLWRQLYAGQWRELFSQPFKANIYSYRELVNTDIEYIDHHHSHAAAGYYTSGFKDATILVIDAIGEWTTTSIWRGEGKKLKKLWSNSYPHSLGLWYSAITERIGLKPNEEEYILMGMAALGDPNRYFPEIRDTFFKPNSVPFKLKHNLHKGCLWWRMDDDLTHNYDVAAATQFIFEEEYKNLVFYSKSLNKSNNLVLMGGCALNCVANSKISHFYDNLWIFPNPGDAGSSLGAALAGRGNFINWRGPLLGHDIVKNYPREKLLMALLNDKITAVANGRAEFGPRALGNRSILADPRGHDVKDRVNAIKKREPFRPFAPAILAEHVHEYFEMPKNINSSPYMQFVAKCKRPDLFPAITHYDGTSRVQTVDFIQYPNFYHLLKQWYNLTGCPMLLNTSLNIKGQPLINDENDVIQFMKGNNLKVL
jgi:carbamoyltransferase